MMKRAVIFDVGGVLCSPPQLAIAAYESRLRLPRYYYMSPDASYVFNMHARMRAGVPLDEYSSLELLIMHSADWRGGSSLFHR